MAKDNKSLGRFQLDGIQPAPRGVPQVEVTFDIDANGILHVKAIEKATNKEQKITISGTSNMSDAEIEKMRKEAEQYAEEDKKRLEEIEMRNKSESLVLQSEKTLKEVGDKVGDDIKKPIVEKIDELKKVLENKDSPMETLKTAYDSLSEELQKVGSELYKHMGQDAQAGAGTEAGNDANASDNKKDDVVEGEVVDGEGK